MQESNKVANAGLKTKPQPGTKIRCVNDGGFCFLTEGKIYITVADEDELQYEIAYLDDEGDVTYSSWEGLGAEKFELVQEEKEQMTTTEQTPDEFKVGDVVYDVVKGKGKVTEIDNGDTYPVFVIFSEDDCSTYTQDGKQWLEYNRTLFFSEPKIEASVKRPFTPTLLGKTVVVLEYACYPQMLTVEWEDELRFGDKQATCIKQNCKVYEVSSENLLKS